MPYFPEQQGYTYWCPNCNSWYYVPPVSANCCVAHGPGECCHIGEQQVPKPRSSKYQT